MSVRKSKAYSYDWLKVVLIGLALLMLMPAFAETNVYSRTTTNINCGVLVLRSGAGATLKSPDPFVFYVMDQRRDIKPAGWSFVNPLASAVAGQLEVDRWGAAAPGLTLGGRIRKDMAPYWEVDLRSASIEKLALYDILLIHVNGNIVLNADEREKLRRFVDGGGLLWIDWTSGMDFPTDDMMFFPLRFTGSSGVPQLVNSTHPLMWSPYELMPGEALSLGTFGGSPTVPAAMLKVTGMWAPIVVSQNNDGIVVASTYGAGHIAITSTNVTGAINGPVGPTLGVNGPNSGLECGKGFLAAGLKELKLSFNMVRWGNAHQTTMKNPRHTNGNFESLGAPLGEKWTTVSVGASQPVAIYNGMIFVVDNNRKVLACFDAIPNRDLDGDGNLDDGARKGTPSGGPINDAYNETADLVWSVQLPDACSAPTVVDAMVPNGASCPMVLLTTATGNLIGFLPYPTVKGVLGPVGISIPTSGGSPSVDCPPVLAGAFITKSIPAPTYSEGLIVVTAPKGVYIARAVPFNGVGGAALEAIIGTTNPLCNTPGADAYWRFPQTQLSTPMTISPPTIPATVGYIPQRGSAYGSDRMVYYGTASSGAPNQQGAAIRCLWLGAKGERLLPINPVNGTATRWRTRAADSSAYIYATEYKDDPRLGYMLRDVDGNRIDGVTIDSNNIFVIPSALTDVYADYSIDWNASGRGAGCSNPGVSRTTLTTPDLPSTLTPQQMIMGGMALCQDSLLVAITQGTGKVPGSLWVLKEGANQATQLVYRWQIPGTATGSYKHLFSGSEVREVVGLPAVDVLFGTGDPAPLTDLRFCEDLPPVQRNGVIYALATGKRSGIPLAILLAFDSNPPAFEIKMGSEVTGSLTIRQPDLQKMEDPNVQAPTAVREYSTLDSSQYYIDKSGSITIKSFLKRGSGTMDALSVSMPVSIQAGSLGENLYFPDDSGGNWNPLLWFMAFPFFEPKSAPMISGDLIYLAGMQTLPPGGNQVGMVWALDADIAPNDSSLIPVKMFNSVGVKQMTILTAGKPNPHIRWPASEAITGMDDFINKIQAYQLPGIASGLVGSEGMLVLGTDVGIKVFEKAQTIIAQPSWILEVDSEGFPTFSMDTTLAGQPSIIAADGSLIAPVVKSTKLVLPTKVYRVTPTEMLIVDTGDNRVVRANRSGFETRSISEFAVDDKYVPAGYRSGDPTSLQQPRDATFWTDYVPKDFNPFTSPSDLEFWVHYLICDTGNNRIVEVVDRFEADPNTRAVKGILLINNEPQIAKLFWHSPANESGKVYSYNAIKRILSSQKDLGNGVKFPLYSYIMTFGNVVATRSSLGLDDPGAQTPRESASGTGGLLLYRVMADGTRVQIVNRIRYKAYDPDTSSYKTVDIPIRGPVSLDVRPALLQPDPSANPNNWVQFEVLITTADGVFELSVPLDPDDKSTTWDVSGNSIALTNDDYSNGLRSWVKAATKNDPNVQGRFIVQGGIPLQATSARWLPNGDIMLCNSWTGHVFLQDYNGNKPLDYQYDFFGEVLALNRASYVNNAAPWHGWLNPINTLTQNVIKQSIPPLIDAPGLKQPQFADRPY